MPARLLNSWSPWALAALQRLAVLVPGLQQSLAAEAGLPSNRHSLVQLQATCSAFFLHPRLFSARGTCCCCCIAAGTTMLFDRGSSSAQGSLTGALASLTGTLHLHKVHLSRQHDWTSALLLHCSLQSMDTLPCWTLRHQWPFSDLAVVLPGRSSNFCMRLPADLAKTLHSSSFCWQPN